MLGGRFAIRSLIGEGGHGHVYEAYDSERCAPVAIKTLNHVNAAGLYQLKNEFRTLSDLVHPNLVTLHELFTEEGRPFISMELVRGTTFLGYVREQGQLRRGRLVRATRQLAEAVSAIHTYGHVHRDLKPSNVLVSPQGRVVVLDFGLVSARWRGGVGDTLVEESIIGTPAYMAPEQAGGRVATVASDWYAVGVMFYEALTGELPFTGSPQEILWAKQSHVPEAASCRVQVPEAWSSLAMQLMAAAPESRFGVSEILQALGATGAAPQSKPPVNTDETPFVGRERELDILREASVLTDEGKPVLVSLSGRSGMGKTALLHRFCRGLADDAEPVVVLSGRCHERETLPYKAFDSVIDALSRYLRRLPDSEVNALLPRDIVSLTRVFPVLQRVASLTRVRTRRPPPSDPIEIKMRAFAALKELLGRIGDCARLVLCIDDMQWGDLDSTKLLIELLSPPNPPGMLCIIAYRSGDPEDSPSLRVLRDALEKMDGAVRRDLEVGALEMFALRALAKQLAADSPSLIERVSIEAQGSPLFLIELLQHAHSRGNLRSPDALPVSLEAAIVARFASLSPAGQRTLESLAVAGRPVERELLMRVGSLSPSVASRALSELARFRLVRSVAGLPQRYEPSHDRVRESVLATISQTSRRRRHRAFAVSLESLAEADPRLLVDHWLGAGQPKRAVKYAIRAAALSARALAFERAAELYGFALDHCGRGGAAVRNLRIARADALANAGRCAEAGRLYIQSLPGAKPTDALHLKTQAAKHLLNSGHVDEGLALWTSVLSARGIELPRTRDESWRNMSRLLTGVFERGFQPHLRAESECSPADLARVDACTDVWLGLWTVDISGRTSAIVGHAVHEALALGEPKRVLRALCILRCGTPTTDSPVAPEVVQRRSSQFREQIAALARALPDADSQAWVHFAAGMSNFWQFRWTEAVQQFDAADALWSSDCVGVTRQLSLVRGITLSVALWGASPLERQAQLGQRAARYVREGLAREDRYLVTWARFYQAELVLRSGDVAGARAALDAVANVWPHRHGVDYVFWTLSRGRVRLELYAGRPSEALALIEQYWEAWMSSDIAHSASFLFLSLNDRVAAMLAVAGKTNAREPLLQAVEQALSQMEGLLNRAAFHTEAWAGRAAVAALRGERAQTLLALDRAEDAATKLCLDLRRAAIIVLRGIFSGEDDHRQLAVGAHAELFAAGIGEPVRWANHWYPGLIDLPLGWKPRNSLPNSKA